jgi:hypothetical protein
MTHGISGLSHMSVELKAKSLEVALSESITFIEGSANPLIAGNLKFVREFQKSRVKARRLGEASKKRMAVGVYGASQAGKSYFVSALAKGEFGRITTRIGNENVDFLQKINPHGGTESTAIVTRFTTADVQTPDKFPIQVRLLSEFDIVSILANSFFNDVELDFGDEFDVLKDAIQKKIDAFPDGPQSEMLLDRMILLEEYCDARFHTSIYYQALKQTNFWTAGVAILGALPPERRWEFLEILWNSISAYTRTYKFLVNELQKLDHASMIYCAPEALFDTVGPVWARRTDSIINVKTLDNLGKQTDNAIEIKTIQGHVLRVGLASVSALAVEVTFCLPGVQSDFFNTSDLLDFPGTRSRHRRSFASIRNDIESLQIENFLRGKVPYLFEQYQSTYEVSALLLLVGPSTQEVVGLNRLVEDWIVSALGARPETREQQPNSLFLVLTKFDVEFGEDAGKESDASRWEARVRASVEEPFGSKRSVLTNWLHRWTSTSHFKNTFWFRSPDIDQAGLVDYVRDGANKREMSFREDKFEFIDRLRRSFVTAEAANRYFKDPAENWDAAMTLNDGGAALVLSELAAVCKVENRLQQIDQQLDNLTKERRADLKRFYVSESNEELAQQKRALARQFMLFGAELLKRDRLGEFIAILMVRDDHTRSIFNSKINDVERSRNAKTRVTNVTEPVREELDPLLADLLGIDTAVEELSKPEPRSTNAEFSWDIVSDFIEDWGLSIKSTMSREGVADYFFLDRDLLIQILNEFEIAAYRSGFVDNLKTLVDDNYQYKTSRAHWVWKMTATLTAQFNSYVSRGGLLGLGGTTVETLSGKQITIFATREQPGNEIIIPERGANFSERYFVDWLNAVQSMIRKNVLSSFKSDTLLMENRRLGEIIAELGAIQTMTSI